MSPRHTLKTRSGQISQAVSKEVLRPRRFTCKACGQQKLARRTEASSEPPEVCDACPPPWALRCFTCKVCGQEQLEWRKAGEDVCQPCAAAVERSARDRWPSYYCFTCRWCRKEWREFWPGEPSSRVRECWDCQHSEHLYLFTCTWCGKQKLESRFGVWSEPIAVCRDCASVSLTCVSCGKKQVEPVGGSPSAAAYHCQECRARDLAAPRRGDTPCPLCGDPDPLLCSCGEPGAPWMQDQWWM